MSEKIDENDEMNEEYDLDISKAIKNPFAGMMKNGYSVTIHYGPQSETPSAKEIIDREIDRIRFVIYDKVHGIPHEKIKARMNDILEAVKNS